MRTIGYMGSIRRRATSAARATKQAVAKAKSAVPKSGKVKSVSPKAAKVLGVTKSSGRYVSGPSNPAGSAFVLRKGPGKAPAKTQRRRPAPSQLTLIQLAAAQTAAPKEVDGRLQASDADVLRVAEAVTKQREELMNRLAR